MLLGSLRTIALSCGGSQVKLTIDQSCQSTGLPTISASSGELQTILQIFFAILGAIAVLFVIVGGLKYTLSGGNPQEMQKAKDTIIYSIVGLIVAISAEAIVSFALSYIK